MLRMGRGGLGLGATPVLFSPGHGVILTRTRSQIMTTGSIYQGSLPPALMLY